MTFRLALRSLASRPVRSGVLACGFGLGIGVMAALLGVGEVILEQARSPDLAGGGDLVVSAPTGRVESARFLLSQVLATPPLEGRVVVASPSTKRTLYLIRGERARRITARGGIPSLERALGDPETVHVDAWRDAPQDEAWTSPRPGDVLRAMDRFHPIPDVPERADSWAEWLYFNGRAGPVQLYVTFLVGPRTDTGMRRAGVRLQLDRGGSRSSYSRSAEIDEAELLESAPDLEIGPCRVRLDGLRYELELNLAADSGPGRGAREIEGRIVLDAVPGRSLPPFAVEGAGGWVSGYVVPVLSGTLGGTLQLGDERIVLDSGTGYHDHNWGFWGGVSWQWGQVAGSGLSFVYGRIRPPEDAADPARLPGFLAAFGPSGPVGWSTDVTIEETDGPDGRPESIRVRGSGQALDLTMELRVESTVATRMDRGSFSPQPHDLDFLQMRARYAVSGRIGDDRVAFTSLGSAETFRAGPAASDRR